MNGRMSKQLRKVAANPSYPEETKYAAIKHQKVMYEPVTDKLGVQQYKDGKALYRPVGVTRIQIVVGACQRRAYKVWKHRYRHFQRRSATLPNVGLNQKHLLS